jgi:hypothetical protein
MFTEVYLRTTDPKGSLASVLKENMMGILVSVLFHSILYWGFVQMVSFIFLGRWLSTAVSMRLCVALVLIMVFGYIGRYYHVRDVYNAYGHDMVKTRAHLDRLYVGWIFIA